MKASDKRILILNGDSTQAIPMAKSLRSLGYIIDVVAYTRLGYGSNSRYVSKSFYFAGYKDPDAYYCYLIEILKSRKYVSVIPCDDYGAIVLSKYKQVFFEYTRYVAPDFDVFEKGYDKHSLMQLCKERGYPHPQTFIVGENLNDVDVEKLPYPLLIKPNHTCGARGMTLVHSETELQEAFPYIYKYFGECHLQQYIPEGGHQVEVQLYIGKNNELVQSSVIKKFRWYPEKGGSSCCNVSAINTEIVDTCYHILLDLGWQGFADFDTIEDPRTGELLILEINPRIPACVKSAFVSGINWADIIIGEYLGKPHSTYTAKEGLYLRHLGFEILWFFYSKNRFSTRPSWFRFVGKNVYYQDMSDWTDPLPFFGGTLGNFIKQLSPRFRKSKSGAR